MAERRAFRKARPVRMGSTPAWAMAPARSGARLAAVTASQRCVATPVSPSGRATAGETDRGVHRHQAERLRWAGITRTVGTAWLRRAGCLPADPANAIAAGSAHRVHAGAGLTVIVDTQVAGAIVAGGAAVVVAATRATPPAVDIALVAVLDAIGAGRSRRCWR